MARVKLTIPQEKSDVNIRVLVLGEKGVGKSALMQRLFTNRFSEAPPLPSLHNTISFKEKTRMVNGHPVTYSISDAVGLADLTKRSEHAQNIDVAYLLFDVTKPSSLENLKQYHDAAQSLNPNCKFILLGSKADLWDAQGEVSQEQVYQFVTNTNENIYKGGCFSAKTGSDENAGIVFDLPARFAMESVCESNQQLPLLNTDHPTQLEQDEELTEQKETNLATPRLKKSCASLFWKFMAHPAVAAIGVVVLLAGVAALLAATYGVGGVALAGVLTIGGGTAAGFGGVSTLLSAIGFCKNRCASRSGGDVRPEAQKVSGAPEAPEVPAFGAPIT